MSRSLKTTIVILAFMVGLGMITLPGLRQAIMRLSGTQRTEEQARHEVMQVPISTPTDVKATAQMYWLSASSLSSLEPTPDQLSLSADPVERSKQLLIALIGDAPAAERRTLPSDATLLAFYIQADGTAIADFSDALQQETPSGILSEQLVVDSITQTLAANVQGISRLKILIHGQAADTLAGHLDLSGFFPMPTPAVAAPVIQAPAGQASAPQAPATQAPSNQAATPAPQSTATPATPSAVSKNPAGTVPQIPASTK